MSGPIYRLQQIGATSKPAEKRLISYILDNTEIAVNMTIAELSEKAEVSYATTCRLCKKLRYDGFKGLKAALSDYMKNDQNAFEIRKSKFDMSQSYTIEEICKIVCELSGAIISDIRKNVDVNRIEQVLDCLLGAKSIYFVGLGTSAVSAHYAYIKLFRLGIPCSHDVDSTLFKMKATLMGKGDVLFAVSSSGRTKSILETAQIAKANGASVISLCDFAISPLTRAANLNLFTTARDTNKFIKDEFPLISGQFAMIDILHACCYNRMYENAQRQFSITKNMADSEKVSENADSK